MNTADKLAHDGAASTDPFGDFLVANYTPERIRGSGFRADMRTAFDAGVAYASSKQQAGSVGLPNFIEVPNHLDGCELTDLQRADMLWTMQQCARAARVAALEEAAKVCEKRAQERFDEHGTTEPDTGATYYSRNQVREDFFNGLDEEDDDCAAAIRALKEQA